ncbi:hypothetical protein [Anaerotalea alkaliphila]|uniref:Uncharacterized protein n=1 Tax=Anaerotalea alkaliphila TaxID=2662126 RepID=A0A7X5HWL1_9FIRM|nr:hypothetical protein [Anaerotalea alkaliphila]NDL68010.1 hypothetical protein [Anaerotalea alkaliphila]
MFLFHLSPIFGGKRKDPPPWKGQGNYHVISASLGGMTFVTTPISYASAYSGDEHISAGITGMSFTVSGV